MVFSPFSIAVYGLRTETGRPASSMRLRAVTPTMASACGAGRYRVRRQTQNSPLLDLEEHASVLIAVKDKARRRAGLWSSLTCIARAGLRGHRSGRRNDPRVIERRNRRSPLRPAWPCWDRTADRFSTPQSTGPRAFSSRQRQSAAALGVPVL